MCVVVFPNTLNIVNNIPSLYNTEGTVLQRLSLGNMYVTRLIYADIISDIVP